MRLLKLYSYVVILTLGVTAAACTSNTTSTEKQDVSAMDSVSKELEKTNKELEDEAKKVEASLEKIDKEFNTSN